MKRLFILLLAMIMMITGGIFSAAAAEPEATYSPEQMDLLMWLLRDSLKNELDKPIAQVELKISDVQLEETSSRIRCTGTVTNTSYSMTYEFIQVKGEFRDSAGSTVDTDITYAAGGEGLAPGESTSFSMSVDRDYRIKDCTVSIYKADEAEKNYPTLASPGWSLEVSDLDLWITDSDVRCTGSVTNRSSGTIYEFVKVKCTFEDSNGTVLDTDNTYAVGNEGLAPGESSTFTMYVDKNPRIKQCTVTIYDADIAQNYYSNALLDAASNLKISNVRLETTSMSMKCTGTVTNRSSSKTYRFVQVKGAFKNSAGQVVDTDSTYAVGSEGLAPGESSTFTMYVDKGSGISSCTVSIFEVG